MKRYIDPLFFLVLFVIDVLVWIFTGIFGPVPASVIIMAPAFFSLTLFALGRVYLNMEAKRFYLFLALSAGVFALALLVTELITPPLEEFDFSTGAWVLVVCALGAVLGLFLAAIEAIPSPEKARLEKTAANARKAEEKNRVKAEQQAQKTRQKAERAAQKKRPVVEVETTQVQVEDN